MLEEIGIEFRDDAEALDLWRQAGADVDGERVRMPRGMARTLLQTAPSAFTQVARKPGPVGHHRRRPHRVRAGLRTALRARPGGRSALRALEDFRNFVKLAMSRRRCTIPAAPCANLSTSRSTSAHLEMIRAHLTLSDKPFMGSVTAPERAEDTIEMARIVLGAETVDNNCCIINLINAGTRR